MPTKILSHLPNRSNLEEKKKTKRQSPGWLGAQLLDRSRSAGFEGLGELHLIPSALAWSGRQILVNSRRTKAESGSARKYFISRFSGFHEVSRDRNGLKTKFQNG